MSRSLPSRKLRRLLHARQSQAEEGLMSAFAPTITRWALPVVKIGITPFAKGLGFRF